MIQSAPAAADILCASATATTATMITIPANRWYTCSMSLSTTAPLAGTESAIITFTPTGTGCGPSATTVVARCTTTGLAVAGTSNSTFVDLIVYGGDSGATLGCTFSGGGSATAVINGYLP